MSLKRPHHTHWPTEVFWDGVTSCTSDASHKYILHTNTHAPGLILGRKGWPKSQGPREKSHPGLWPETRDLDSCIALNLLLELLKSVFIWPKQYLKSMYLDDGLYLLIGNTLIFKLIFYVFFANDDPQIHWSGCGGGTGPSWPDRVVPDSSSTRGTPQLPCSHLAPTEVHKGSPTATKEPRHYSGWRSSTSGIKNQAEHSSLDQKTAKKKRKRKTCGKFVVRGDKPGGQEKSFHFVFA